LATGNWKLETRNSNLAAKGRAMILRSRAIAGQAVALANPLVDRALDDWRKKVDGAHEVGRQAGLAEAQARIAAAEARAVQAEAAAKSATLAAEQALQARLGQAITALDAALGSVEALEKQVMLAAEAEMVALATRVAARVLHREIESGAWVQTVVAAALARMPDRRGVAVRLHPEDAALAREARRAIGQAVPGVERLEFFDDPGLERGACILASQGTRLDASLQSSWERVSFRLMHEAPDVMRAVGGDGTPAASGHPVRLPDALPDTPDPGQ